MPKQSWKKTDRLVNAGLFLLSLVLGCSLIEIAFRIFPWADRNDYQINNPYYYIERIGTVKFFIPYTTYEERVPLQFDHQAYYTPTRGSVYFHTNQFGARWIKPTDQPQGALTMLILGDSFTYGHGLHYQDTYIYQLQQKLEKESQPLCFLNFARRGADAEEILTIYQQLKPQIPHDAVGYGLNVNDLVAFRTSYVITNPCAIPWMIERSKAWDFMAKRLHKFFIRRYRIQQLTNPALFRDSFFSTKFQALIQLKVDANEQRVPFLVILLPILVDLKKATLRPLYDGIIERLEAVGIEYIDLTHCLDEFEDREVWILPFDQHPNAVANRIFAEKLSEELQTRQWFINQMKLVDDDGGGVRPFVKKSNYIRR